MEKKVEVQRSLYRWLGLILQYFVKPFPNNAIIFLMGSHAKVWPLIVAMLKIRSASKSHNGKSVIQWLFPAIWFPLADWFQKRRWKKANSLKREICRGAHVFLLDLHQNHKFSSGPPNDCHCLIDLSYSMGYWLSKCVYILKNTSLFYSKILVRTSSNSYRDK